MGAQKFTQLVCVDPAFIAGLVFHPPGHFAHGQAPKNATFVWRPEGCQSEEMFPLTIKVGRDGAEGEPTADDLPVEGRVYKMILTYDPATSFVDGSTGKRCRSRDRWVAYLYPRTREGFETQAVMGADWCAAEGEEIVISPRPIHQVGFHGTHRKGVLWFAQPGEEHVVRRCRVEDRVAFSGPIVVDLGDAKPELRPGSVRYELRDGESSLTAYDRRRDRLSSFARAEMIERTVIGGRLYRRHWIDRSFTFVNLRDIPEAEVEDTPPERILTHAGLQQL